MANTVVAITTLDNPYDPIDDFKSWYAYDVQKGYCTCSYLARVSSTASSLSPAEYNYDREQAIDSIVNLNPLIYRKIVRQVS